MGKLSSADIESAYRDFRGESRKIKKKKPVKIKTNKENSSVVRYTEDGKPVTVYASHLDQNAWQQASHFASLPFVHPKGMSLMPDVHAGKDIPVGSVLPTLGVLVPAAVGVDIGCGMMAVRLNINSNQLPDNIRRVRMDIERVVPMNSGGRHKEIPAHVSAAWEFLHNDYQRLIEKYPKVHRPKALEQLGTLGSGNHFIEMCLDESDQVWVMLHSGSRGAGSLIGQYFMEQALRRTRDRGLSVKGFGWLTEDDPLFHGYVESVEWAQRFAQANRESMMRSVLEVVRHHCKQEVKVVDDAISCHHNYIARESFDGQEVWVTRKGAIRASQGQLGIVPGAMGQESFIVRGKGNQSSWCSCSHGAGRVMSRTAAVQRFTSKDMKEALKGVECRKDRGVIDEIPLAYKPLRSVMKDQQDLVEVVHTLKAFMCSKGI